MRQLSQNPSCLQRDGRRRRAQRSAVGASGHAVRQRGPDADRSAFVTPSAVSVTLAEAARSATGLEATGRGEVWKDVSPCPHQGRWGDRGKQMKDTRRRGAGNNE
jgi:hypothetical protein